MDGEEADGDGGLISARAGERLAEGQPMLHRSPVVCKYRKLWGEAERSCPESGWRRGRSAAALYGFRWDAGGGDEGESL